MTLKTNIPRYFIAGILGEATLGVFSALSYLLVIGRTAVTALAQAISPRAARHFNAGRPRSFLKLILVSGGIFGLLPIIGILIALIVGEEIVTLIYGPAYGGQNHVFILLLLYAIPLFSVVSLYVGLVAARSINILTISIIISVVFTSLFSYLLIPEHGLVGAAIALLGVELIRFVLLSGALYYAYRNLSQATDTQLRPADIAV